MGTEQVAAIFILVALQLLILRAAQRVVPSFYFTTSALFDERSDVSGAAVLFRLSIPLVTGMVAVLLIDHEASKVAAIAGGAAWFLVIWPIIWSPALVDHPLHWPFLSVLAGFWLSFICLPMAGVALVTLIQDTFAGTAPEWQSQFAWILVALPVTAGVNVLNRLASKRLSFADDPYPDDEPYAYEPEREPRVTPRRTVARYLNLSPPLWLWLLFASLLALVRRLRP